MKTLSLIIKTDVVGMAEAVGSMVMSMSNEDVEVKVLQCSSGEVTEGAVQLAISTKSKIIAFNTSISGRGRSLAKENKITIESFNVIYKVSEYIREQQKALMDPIFEEIELGVAEVRQVFKLSNKDIIAGCMVVSGKITRNSLCRLLRGGAVITESKVVTLKRFKDDAKEVDKGFECGIGISFPVEAGDRIVTYELKQVK